MRLHAPTWPCSTKRPRPHAKVRADIEEASMLIDRWRTQALDAGRDPEVVRIETLELDAWLGLPGLREEEERWRRFDMARVCEAI